MYFYIFFIFIFHCCNLKIPKRNSDDKDERELGVWVCILQQNRGCCKTIFSINFFIENLFYIIFIVYLHKKIKLLL